MEKDANYIGTVCSRTAQFVPQRSIRRIFQEKRLSFISHIRLQGFGPQAELVFSLSPSQDVLINIFHCIYRKREHRNRQAQACTSYRSHINELRVT